MNDIRTNRLGARLVALAALSAMALAACGDSDSGPNGAAAAVDCPGAPVKLMTISNVAGPGPRFPGIPASAEAAAAAVNATCELGRPVTIISCDEKSSPNDAAACARRAVSEEVTAVVGSFTANGDSIFPILEAAKIPAVGGTATGSAENTSPMSFPLDFPVISAYGWVSAAASAGATKITITALDLPAVAFSIDLSKQHMAKLGLELVGEVPIPPQATDLTQYAAQVLATGSDGIIMLDGPGHVQAMLKALEQQGADLSKLHFVTGASASPTTFASWGPSAENVYVCGAAWPSNDSSNPGIKQFRDEMDAAGKDLDQVDDPSVHAWGAVHIVADLLEGSPTLDAATLLTKIDSAGRIDRPETTPVDWSKPAFPDDPVLSTLRVFGRDQVCAQIRDGELVPVTDGFVDATQKTSFT